MTAGDVQRSTFGVRRSAFGAWLREPGLWSALLLGLVFWPLAYQLPYSHLLDVGGSQETRRRYDDIPFIDNFNPDPEPAPPKGDGRQWWELPQPPFRWTREVSSVRLPGLGGERWIVTVDAAGQPHDAPTVSSWSDGHSDMRVELGRGRRVYRFLARPDARGDLHIMFTTTPFSPTGDPRSLGFVTFRIVATSTEGFQAPPPLQLGMLAGTLALIYGGARLAGLGAPAATVGAAVLAALAALLLATARAGLTVFTPSLLATVASSFGLLVVLRWLLRAAERGTTDGGRWATVDGPANGDRAGGRWLVFDRRSSVVISHLSFVAGLIALAFALRLGGMLHPHTRFSDIGLNANNLAELTRGSVYQTEGLPAETGGGQAPYPPAQYIILAPAQLLLPPGDEARRLLIKAGGALLDGTVVGWIWYVLRRGGYGQRAALLGAALYIVPPPLLRSFSIGEFANISGQALALPALGVLGLLGARLRERPVFLAGAALLPLALLGHSGVTISLALLLGCLVTAWMLAPGMGRSVVPLVLLGALVAVVVGLLYYSAFVDLFLGRAADAAPPPDLPGFPARIWRALRFAVGDPGRPLSALVVALGAAGLLLVGTVGRASAGRAGIPPLLIAWWGASLLSLGALLAREQTLRWDLFIYPALCLGGGVALATIWRRGRAASLLAAAGLVYLLWNGLALWVERLANYLHD